MAEEFNIIIFLYMLSEWIKRFSNEQNSVARNAIIIYYGLISYEKAFTKNHLKNQ